MWRELAWKGHGCAERTGVGGRESNAMSIALRRVTCGAEGYVWKKRAGVEIGRVVGRKGIIDCCGGGV
jgi:hypothetical protein